MKSLHICGITGSELSGRGQPGRAAASHSFPALGGTAVVATTDRRALSRAVRAVTRTVAEIDAACSPFRGDSELSAVNRAGGRPVAVSPLFAEALAASLRAARLTGGDVDPTIGSALVAYGFYDGDAAAPQVASSRGAASRLSLARVPGYETIALELDRSRVTVGAGVRLDLGATAKALAADRAAAAACAAAGCGVLVSLSGDLSICGSPPAGGWRVRVTDDHRSTTAAPGQWITLRGGGLATSSTTVRRREPAHHLIDPASGHPCPVHFRTVSVAAASCLDANIASTAAIVRGAPALGWLDDGGLPSRLVRAGGTVAYAAGWPADGDDLGARR